MNFLTRLFETDVRGAELPVAAPRSVEVVIARYAESNIGAIIAKLPKNFKVIVYNKGDAKTLVIPKRESGRVKIIPLPNVGRDAHTFLHHIIANYKSGLADVTMFLPGSALDNSVYPKSSRFDAVLEAVTTSYTSAFPAERPVPLSKLYDFEMSNYVSTNKANKSINPQSSTSLSRVRPFGKWYEHVFKGLEVPDKLYVCYNCIFAADIAHIKQRNLSFYKKLISFVDNHSSPEAVHFLERSWTSMFYPFPDYCLRKIKGG
jgi:hypothetical protein